MKTYRGSPAAARNYVEADRSRADDYYLAEGTGVADRFAASADGRVTQLESLSGDGYEAWVAGVDPDTGAARGRVRHDDRAVRFVEVIVNGPKTWSLAAALHPDIAAAYDAAQDAAAAQIIAWLGQHASTRVGPRGAQVQLPVEQLEAAVVRHYTSRAGDPHRHLHLQINARVFAAGRWRGLHTVGVRDSLDAINGIGHAAVASDPGFRVALARHGFTLDAAGEVRQLASFAGAFSARAAQIGRNLDRYEADWSAAHPGRTPGPALRRSWDARAWAQGRPDKIHPAPGADLDSGWVAELRALGYIDPPAAVRLQAQQVGSLDRDQAVAEVLSRLAARRSGWNAADVRGEVEQLLARHDIVTGAAVRLELAEDLTARTLADCVPLLQRDGVPEHIRALTSPDVLAVETEIVERLAARGHPAPEVATDHTQLPPLPDTDRLDETQVAAARVLAGEHALIVLEGAAGAGKTSTLTATRDLLAAQGRRLTVVTPTLKAAKVAQAELGSRAGSAAALVFQHGFRWDSNGRWTRLNPGQTDPATGSVYAGPARDALLRAGGLLLVDEAGMLDQDTARALLTIADEHAARVALVGDRHQLSAVGRGGVLDLAARWAAPEAVLTLDVVHRFTRAAPGPDGRVAVVPDVDYAALSLLIRSGEEPATVFDTLLDRGQIRIHSSEAARLAGLADAATTAITSGGPAAVIADTNDQVTALNHAVRERLVTAGWVDDIDTVMSVGGAIGVGDRVVTRRNDTSLGVANRDQWTVTAVHPDGGIVVAGAQGARVLPPGYVREFLELGYAYTVHGVQGQTVTEAHLLLAEHTGASSAYVAMTRGRQTNIAHLVAADVDEAREQWVAAFGRDRADLGPAHAAELAHREAANYAEHRPLEQALADLHTAWVREHDARLGLEAAQQRRDLLEELVAIKRENATALAPYAQHKADAEAAAAAATERAKHLDAIVAAHAEAIAEPVHRQWDAERGPAREAAQTVRAGTGRFGHRVLAVRQATEHLHQWSYRWQPYLPDMPTTTQRIVDYAARWFDTSPDQHRALDEHGRTTAEHVHPEQVAARSAAVTASERQQAARIEWQNAAYVHDPRLKRFGRLAHASTAAVEDWLTRTDAQLVEHREAHDAARSRVEAVLHEPAIRTLPAGQLEDEKAGWRAKRQRDDAEQQLVAATQPAAEREATQAPYWSQPAPSWEPPTLGPEQSSGITR